MTVKLSELRVRSAFEAGAYVAGMDQKIAADQAGAASSQRLGAAFGQTYQKIANSGNVIERLSKTYIDGYAASRKFDSAIESVGKAMNTGSVPLAHAEILLEGIYRKYGMVANATDLAKTGYLALSQAVGQLNTKLEQQGRLANAPASPRSALAINQRLGIGAPALGDRSADIEAYGRSLDDLKARFSPLFAVERAYRDQVGEITKAHKLGAISQDEMAVATAHAEVAYRTQARSIQQSNTAILQSGKNAALSSYAMTNLGFQINDVATQAALGMSPLRILAAQGGQFYQILAQGEGGVRGSMSYLMGALRGLITPFRLATGGALGLAGAAVMAAGSWKSAQRDISLALMGTGAAAGVTAADINRIAAASAASGKQTVGDARDMALALAATGRIGADMIAQITAIGPKIGKVFGEDGAAAAQRLGKAFEDPAKGVEELNKRLSVFDAADVARIKSLSAQNLKLDAQQLLIRGIATATAEASSQTSGWASAWTRLTASASGYWAAAGQAIDKATGGGTLEDQLAFARANLDKVKAGPGLGLSYSSDANAIAEEEYARLQTAVADYTRAQMESVAAQKSLDLADAIHRALPAVGEVRTLTDAVEGLKRQLLDPVAVSRLPKEEAEQKQRSLRVLEEQRKVAALKASDDRTSLDIAKEESALALQSIGARTTAQQAEIAYQQTLQRLKFSDPDAEFKAQAERQRVLAEGGRRVSDEIRQRNFAAAQGLDSAKLELSLVGRTTDEAAALRAEYEAIAAVKAQAFSGNRTAGTDEIEAARKAARATADVASQTRRDQFMEDIDFERAQLGRTQGEQAIYARLRSEGKLDHGEITAANEFYAVRLRQLDLEKQINEAGREFASGLVKDLVAGKSAAESLSNALSNLSQKLLDAALDQALSSVFGAVTGDKSKGTGGSSIFAGIFHAGGVVANDNPVQRAVSPALFANAPRYHSGGVAGRAPGLAPGEVPAILQRGEIVLPRGASVKGDAPVVVHVTTHINAQGAYPESIADIKRTIAEQQASLRAQITEGVRDARERRLA